MAGNRIDSPKGLQLNPSPPGAVRVTKRAGMIGIAIVAVVAILIVYGASRRRQQQAATVAAARDAKADSALPAADVLKTDLIRSKNEPPGARYVSGQTQGLMPPPLDVKPNEPRVPDASYTGGSAPHELTPEEKRRQSAYQKEVAAMEAPSKVEGAAVVEAAQQASSSANLVPAAYARPGGPGAGGQSSQDNRLGNQRPNDYDAQNAQEKKEAFLGTVRQRQEENYLKATRTAQLGPYEIKAGWNIPAVLEQALNSDLPGEIRALVRENVYDTASGKFLLIPQGSRLIGIYSSNISYGQDGVQAIWTRVIFPDGSSLNLDNMNGLDEKGLSGLRFDVDHHYRRLFATALLTSLFAAGLQLSQNTTGGQNVLTTPSPAQAVGQAVGAEVTQMGVEITRKNLNVQPTIKIPIGYRFNVRVNRDIIFDLPYVPYPQR